MYDFAFISFVFFLCTGLNIFSAVLMWPRRRMKGALTLFGLMLAFVIWTFCSGMEISSTTLSGDVFWSKIAYIGSCSVPVLFFIFALQFTDRDKYLTSRRTLLLWGVPVISILLVMTNEYHHLIWTAVMPNPAANQVLYVYYHGLWFWVLNVYSYVLLVFATLLLVMEAIRQQKIYRKQAHVILMGIPLPWIANLLYISGFSPLRGFDLTPIMFTITGLLYALGLYRYELLDVVPVARNKIFEDLEDGLVVLDMHNRIVDVNPAAGRMLGLTSGEVIGSPIGIQAPTLSNYLEKDVSQLEIQLRPDLNEWQELRVSPAGRWQGNGRGKIANPSGYLQPKTYRGRTHKQTPGSWPSWRKWIPSPGCITAVTPSRRWNWRSRNPGISGAPLAMGEIDLDNFKGINDRFGHIRGDKVLQEVAKNSPPAPAPRILSRVWAGMNSYSFFETRKYLKPFKLLSGCARRWKCGNSMG